MENYGDRIKESYSLIHSGKKDEAKISFQALYDELLNLDYKTDEDLKRNLVSVLLGLGELNMKEGLFEECLKYYETGDKLTSGKDFNILFNLGVVYRNLGRDTEALEILNKAKKIEPNNPNLIRFLTEMDANDSQEQNNDSGNNVSNNFLDKINSIVKEINNK